MIDLPKEYTTGFEAIDELHTVLFSFLDDFRENLETGCGENTYDLFLDTLSYCSEIYFSIEKAFLEEYPSPLAERLKDEYLRFEEFVSGEIQRYQGFGFDPQRAWDLLDRMDNWLLHDTGVINRLVDHSLINVSPSANDVPAPPSVE